MLFDILASAPSSRTAIIHGDQTLSFGALQNHAIQAANALFALGLRKGDRVAVMLPNSAHWLAVNFGAALLGVAVVSLNIRLGAKEVGDLVSRTSARAIVYDPAILDGAVAATLKGASATALESLVGILSLGQCDTTFALPGAAKIDLLSLLQDEAHNAPDFSWRGRGSDPCFIMATSGTTDRPKLVVHQQGGVVRHVKSVAQSAGLMESGARSLVAMPFSGAFGFTLIMSALASGQTTVIAEGFDAVRTGELIRSQMVSHMGGTNDMLYNMLNADSRPYPFPSLKAYTHANFTPSLTEMPTEAERRHVPIRGAYGLSELLAFVSVQPLDAALEQRAEAGGHLVDPGAAFRIVDPETDQFVADGEIGEIQVHTPNAMWGYLGDPDATAAAFTSDGFLRTGDLGRRLPDGGLIFDSRKNDVLRIGGYLVSPVEIEDAILDDRRISACQVVAVSLPAGMRPVAFVVADPGAADEQALIAVCRTKLAKYKVPVRVFYVDQFPTVDGPNGKKVKRNELRDLAQRMLLEECS